MKSLLALPLIVLGISITAHAQEPLTSATFESAAATATVSSPSVPQSTPESNIEPSLLALAAPRPGLAALSFAAQPSAAAPTSPAATSGDPRPGPQVTYRYNERDYRLEIALGVAIVRFRSPVYEATGVGTHTAVAYFLKDWLAAEGVVTTAFAPTIYANEHVKYLSYAGGAKFSLGRARFEPWLHALAGGIHLVPQTALSGKNGFELTAGIGLDYGLTPRVSLRFEGDYLGSHIFNQWENSAQGIVAIVMHF